MAVKRGAGLITLVMLLMVLALGQVACAEVATAALSPEGDLLEGLRFFKTSREACESDIGYIPDKYQIEIPTDTSMSDVSTSIGGDCTLLGRRWGLMIDTGDAMSIMISAEVERSRAMDLFQAVDARLAEKWGSFKSEMFLDEDYYSSENGGSTGGVVDSDAPYMREWRSGGCICTLFLTRAKDDKVDFMISFDKPSWLKLKESESPAEAGGAPNTVYFRATRWGMTPKEVQSAETDHTLVSFDGLDPAEPGTAATQKLDREIEVLPGFPAKVHFCFAEGGLFIAGYEYTQKHPNPDDYLDDYAILKKWLILRYGQPKADVVSLDGWIQPADARLHGKDVPDGRLELISRFQAGDTSVVLSLTGSFGDIELVENYHNINEIPVVSTLSTLPGR